MNNATKVDIKKRKCKFFLLFLFPLIFTFLLFYLFTFYLCFL